jgi:hypothetical protein
MGTPQIPTNRFLEPGDVIYTSGWDFCYQIVSGPFCRIHYLHWKGTIASTPSDSSLFISYLIRVLGGKTTSRIIIQSSLLNLPLLDGDR